MHVRRISLLALSICSALAAPGDLDPSFIYGSGVEDGTVYSLSLQSGGRVVAGGFFSNVDGRHHSGVVRFLSSGILDDQFHADSLGGHLHIVLAQPDGKILVGGEFDGLNLGGRNDLARLNSDGSLDSSFSAGRGPGGFSQAHIDALALTSDGRIIVAGDFTDFNYQPYAAVVRLFPDGRLDSSFTVGDEGLGHLTSVIVDPEQRVIISGSFTNVQGTARLGFTRFLTDGNLDHSFAMYPGPERDDGGRVTVSAVALQPDGKILIGGNFTRVNGHPCPRLARLNPDGTLDGSFNIGSGIAGSSTASVGAIAVQKDSKVLIAGLFTSVAGIWRTNVARLNRDGSLDTTFNPGLGPNANVTSIALSSLGQPIIAGAFTAVNGSPRGRLARFQGDATHGQELIHRLTVARNGSASPLHLGIIGASGCSYTIESSLDLRSWQTLTNIIAADTITPLLDPQASTYRQRFYRLLTPSNP